MSPVPEHPLLFDVLPYAPEELERLLDGSYLARYVPDYPQAVISSVRLKVLQNYFSPEGVGAQTVVVEPSYIDGDYLEDYAGHYSRCFRPYWRKCTRLHFFSASFREETFHQFLLNTLDSEQDEKLLQSYLGFIVRRPLPRTVIGRTCLVAYPRVDGRAYPTLRTYEVHLFGRTLSISSVAFQEQDKTVSACATSAMWSAFHVTGKRFQHPIYSPSDITRIANERHPLENRGIPSGGLNIQQLAACLRSVGLEPYGVDLAKNMPIDQRERLTRESVYAYAHLGLPVLLGFTLVDAHSGTAIGRHVGTVLGYQMRQGWTPPAGSGIPFRSRLSAQALQKLYVHDDQVGPFARMELDGVITPGIGNSFSLSTGWGETLHRAVPTHILVPLYHKIRIPYDRILQTVEEFDQYITKGDKLPELPSWDIFLTTTCEFREHLRSIRGLNPEEVVTVLTTSYPRFLWQASASWSGHRAFDLLFDATDLAQSDGFVDLIPYDRDARRGLCKLLSKISPKPGSASARIAQTVLSGTN